MGGKTHKGWNISGARLGDQLTKLTADDWEPYAMTNSPEGVVCWVKKYVPEVAEPERVEETAEKFADWPWYYIPVKSATN